MPDTTDLLLQEFQQIAGTISDSSEGWSSSGGQGGQRDTAPRGNVDALGDQTGSIDHGRSSSSSSSNSGGTLSDIGGAWRGRSRDRPPGTRDRQPFRRRALRASLPSPTTPCRTASASWARWAPTAR